MSPALAAVPSDRIRDNGHKQKGRKFYLSPRKNHFDRALEDSPERMWSLLLGNIQNPPGHGPVQPALNEPALAEGFD